MPYKASWTYSNARKALLPQTYLGLPLSNVKLPLSAFAPLIAKVDKYLASWQALLLSTAARVVLINSVLAGIPTYAMGAMLLPPGVVTAIDARRRAFLWTGSDSVSGAQCLVAWDNVCRAKEDGGLGIKQLDTQNACLLMKLLHRLHHPADSAWAHWIGAHVHLPDLGGDMARAHWTALRDLLPAYQCITIVSVGDSRDTSFWDDTWLLDVPLADKMPALHSHFTARATSVRDVLGAGLRNLLHRRLTAQATEELEHLEVLLQDIDLIESPDQRSSFFEDGDSHRLCKAP